MVFPHEHGLGTARAARLFKTYGTDAVQAEKLPEVPRALIATAVDLELAEGIIAADSLSGTPCVFLRGLNHAERHCRSAAASLGALPWPKIDADKALSWIAGQTGFTLAASQDAAIRLAALQGAGHHRRSQLWARPPS